MAGASAKRPKLTITLWLVLIAGCGIGGSLVGTRSLSTADSGSGESGTAELRLQDAGLLDRFTESLIVKSGSAARTKDATAVLARRARTARFVTAVDSPAANRSLSRDGGRFALVEVTLRGDPDQETENVVPLERVVSGTARAERGVYVGEAGDGSFGRAESNTISSGMGNAEMIALPLTLLILVIAFGALVAALVPLLLGVTSVAAALGALGLVSQIAPNGSVTSSVVVLIGLAVGIDYSLFYIRRERAERRAGAGPQAALSASAQTVGRAVLIAGATVIIALVGLLFTGNPVFVSMALGAILVVAIAVLGSLTVLPATLALLGDRIDHGRLRRRRGSRRSSLWPRSAVAVTARPVGSLLLATLLVAVLASPLLSIRLGNPGSADLPPQNPTVIAQRLIDRAFPGGTDTAQLVVSGHNLGTQRAKTQLARLGREGERITGGGGQPVTVAVSRNADTAVVGIPVPSGGDSVQNHNVEALRTTLKPAAARALRGSSAEITGDDASNVDFNHQMALATPLVIGFVLALAFLLLVFSFRSPLLAVSVVALNLVSVGGAFGVLTELFQHHWVQTAFGLRSFGAIVDWIPLFAFVLLFGLSMDYTVLILERASEARRRGACAREAAAEALTATGSTVTSAALVMVCVFATFATVPLISFQQLGVGLAAAIAIDATIVRAVALPAVLTLLGDRGLRPATRRRPRAQAWDDRARAVAISAVNE
jgi:RND superfamily putative drug exporter